MTKRHLDRSSFVPLYAQIHQTLLQRISSGELSPGANVPSERELAEEYGVSRMTARQSLRALRHDGLVFRERGVGTFVSKRKVDVHTRNLVGFSEDMRQRGFQPSSQLLKMERTRASAAVAEVLGIEAGDEIFHLERLRLADNIPMAFEANDIAASLCPKLDRYDFQHKSLYDVLEKKYGIYMQRADEVLEAALPTKAEAVTLSIKPTTPVLVVSRVVYSDSNQVVESVRTIYRADRYRATFHLTKSEL